MMKIFLAAALLGGASLVGAAAFAAEGTPEPPVQSWSFTGPLGKFDRAQLQRGFKVYREVCSTCHSLGLVSFRNLSQPGGPEFSEGQVRALAAEYRIATTDDNGQPTERPGLPADRFPPVYANEKMARATNNGALPPDFSLLAKARTYERGFPRFIIDIFSQFQTQGPDYIVALLNGYENPPAGMNLLPGQHYNKYMPGHLIAMADPLGPRFFDNAGNPIEPDYFPDKTPVTRLQLAKDVTAFMAWAAEPHLEQRKSLGVRVMLFLLVFAGLMYFAKKRVWKDAPGEAYP